MVDGALASAAPGKVLQCQFPAHRVDLADWVQIDSIAEVVGCSVVRSFPAQGKSLLCKFDNWNILWVN